MNVGELEAALEGIGIQADEAASYGFASPSGNLYDISGQKNDFGQRAVHDEVAQAALRLDYIEGASDLFLQAGFARFIAVTDHGGLFVQVAVLPTHAMMRSLGRVFRDLGLYFSAVDVMHDDGRIETREFHDVTTLAKAYAFMQEALWDAR